MKKRTTRILGSILVMTVLVAGCAKTEKKDSLKLEAKNPVTISIWHYYNGGQLEAFEEMVTEFNDTTGKEKGVIVESSSQGSVSDLETNVLAAANRKAGAEEVPNIFAAYADTAYAVDKLGLVVELSDYLSKKEKDAFVENYLLEGAFPTEDSLKMFPIAKSTEIFMVNQTDWQKFASETGTAEEELRTVEGVTSVAQKYYEWTDSLTPEANDGRAFFGRDAMANYMIIGSKQLGIEIFTVKDDKSELNFDQEVARKLWDNYYIPQVKGYFDATGRFRSDDIKTGNIIAFVGSCSGATFFPKEVILNDTQSYPIEMTVLPAPMFDGGEKVSVQQGASMVVTKSEDKNEKEVLGSLEFLKWFVEDERNIRFSMSSGYLPVTESANDIEKIESSMDNQNKVTKAIVETALSAVHDTELYTTKAFKNGTKARNVLEYSLSDLAKVDKEVVKQRLQEGVPLEEAAAEFASDAYFETWYTQTKEQLEALVK